VPDDAICVIALDGENPWAGYRENGVPFLRELYGRILKPASYLFTWKIPRSSGASGELEIVPAPGWEASPNGSALRQECAWDLLSRTREKCGPSQEIYIAEAPTVWWFGEDNVAEFDTLFRAISRPLQGKQAGRSDG